MDEPRRDIFSVFDDLAAARARIAELERERDEARRCLAFFRSVIKSGESWTETCEREYDAARGESDG